MTCAPRHAVCTDRGDLQIPNARTIAAIRERVFAALAGREQVRDVVVQLVTCSGRGSRVRVRACLDTGDIVMIERSEEDVATSPDQLAAAIVVAVERATTLPESEGNTSSLVGGGPRRP